MGNPKSYYAVIPANVRYDDDIPANAKLLYGEITALCNDKGYCWASNDYFAKLYNVSNRSITRWIKSLTDKGYIDYLIGPQEGNKRYLYLPNLQTKMSIPTDKNIQLLQTKMSNIIIHIIIQLILQLIKRIKRKNLFLLFLKVIRLMKKSYLC